MHLLKTGRMIQDEGLLRFFKIGFNIATHPKAAKRILNMRSVFIKYEKLMNAVALVAEKTS